MNIIQYVIIDNIVMSHAPRETEGGGGGNQDNGDEASGRGGESSTGHVSKSDGTGKGKDDERTALLHE